MAMANRNLFGAFETKLWPEQALACGGGATKNIIPPNFVKFRGYNYMYCTLYIVIIMNGIYIYMYIA